MSLDPNFLEKLMVKAMMVDKQYLTLISSAFMPEYFDNSAVSSIFSCLKEQLESVGTIPSKDIVINTVNQDVKDDVIEVFTESESIDFDLTDQQYLLSETNEYLKEQAIKKAIIESVNIIDNRGEKEAIRKSIEDALCKDLTVDLGLRYFQDLGARLRRIFTASDVRVPVFFPQFDEYLGGGFPPFTLSVLVARIHGFKSNSMANFAARQVLQGYTPVIMTLEMAQDAYAQRFDSIYSQLDINRMYSESQHRELMEKLGGVKSIEDRGELYIKQFPTGEASIRDFRIYLRELLLRGIEFHILYVDYINLMKSIFGALDMYSRVKSIAEELRALSFEFKVPVVSVSQLNREGSFVGFEELDFIYIAESLGLPATADFMAILGTDDDSLVYESEIHYKIIKNRLAGRVGEIGKMYVDTRNLKMYDESELDMWIADAQISGDERNLAAIRTQQETGRRRRG